MTPDTTKWVERIVCQNEIYFAAARSFNDPFDLRPVFSLAAPKAMQIKDYERLSKKFEPLLNRQMRRKEARQAVGDSLNPARRQATEEAIQELHAEHITEQVGVLCVSTKRDDILMWSHYADSHRGICLEFDGHFAFMAQAQKVEYARKRSPINVYVDSEDAAMKKALLTKSEQWAYEEEWRLIRYEHGPGSVQFRPRNLTGIIIGAAASQGMGALIQQWACARAEPLTIYQAKLSKTDYAVDIHRR
ncbi:MAG: DUF2971 domain-containing protein [Limnohabitans sp.]